MPPHKNIPVLAMFMYFQTQNETSAELLSSSFLCSTSPSDHQAIGHCHCADARPPSAPHHAYHGLRAAAFPAAAQPHEDRPGEELCHALLAGVTQTHDGGELPWELAGTPAALTELKIS